MGDDLTDRRLARSPIAIVGMSGLFPMARTYREYWQNIIDGVDCTQEVPDSRWRVSDYFDPDPEAPDKSYVRRGAFLPDIDFDPLEFGLPPNQLEVTSMVQVLSLVVARDLLRDAGAPDSPWYDPARTGIVLGATGRPPLVHGLTARLTTPVLKEVIRSCGLSDEDAEAIAGKYVAAFPQWQESAFPGYLLNVVAGRVANRLDFGGMNCTVDAACAASLAAVRLAVAELVDGRADMMIAGGVDTESTIYAYVSFASIGALARSEEVKPLSATADGTLLGEGIGMVALKRLADAERDGDRVYAVIRGIGSSSDGRAKSVYAPNASGQRIALERAYQDADCSPVSVELFEAHAPGTVVGDRTELSVLDGVLRSAGGESRFAAVGSVKSQIGHAKAAAGVASLMKAALGLHQKVLPGTINVDQPSEAVDFANSPFYVNSRTRPWILDPARPVRRAGVSAMGFGGTNFHVVLEEYPAERTERRVLHRAATAHLWHAPDRLSLLELVRAGAPAGDGAGIPADHARVGFVAVDDAHAETLRALAVRQLADMDDAEHWSHPRGVFYRRNAMADLRVGALFAGQGSQYVNMGMSAVLGIPAVARAFDLANSSFAGAPVRLSQVVFPAPAFDDETLADQETLLRRTEYSQPAVGALSAGQFTYLRELGLVCSAYAGHSFGELTALWASGALREADYHRIAAARGAAMAPREGLDPGAMAAVFASREWVTDVITKFPGLVVCNHNSPNQLVVGGGTEQIERLVAECRKRKVKAVRLKVAAAFHTEHVGYAVEAFGPEAVATTITEPDAPVYANTAGASYGADSAANARTLIHQLRQPVEFVDALRRMHTDGVNVFVEFGPQQVLTQFVTETLGEDVEVFPVDAGPKGDSDLMLKRAAVRLAVLGMPLSGINRYAEPIPAPAPAKGPTVSLSANEFVPAERRAQYEAAITSGYRIDHSSTGGREIVPDSLDQYLRLHAQYLESQSRLSAQIADSLSRPMNAHVASVVAAAARLSEAVGQSHARAGEVLARLAGAEAVPAYLAPDVAAPPTGNGHSTAITFEPAPALETLPEPVRVGVSADAHTQNGWAPRPEPADEQAATPEGSVATLDDVRNGLIQVISEKTGFPVAMLEPTMDLETDLGVDSIKRVQVLAALRKKMPQLLPPDPAHLNELRTADQIAAYLVQGSDADPKASEAGARSRRHIVELAGLPAVDVLDEHYRPSPVAVIVADDRAAGDLLAAALTATGWTVRRAQPGAEFGTLETIVTDELDLCLFLPGAEPSWESACRNLAAAVLLAKQAAVATPSATHRSAFVTITRLDGGLGLRGGSGPVASLVGGVGGVVKTLAHERPALFCRAVDVDPRTSESRFIAAVLDEIRDAARDTPEVGVDAAGARWTVVPGLHGPAARISEIGGESIDDIPLTDRDVLLVTGGARGVTAQCVRALAAATPARFVLLGRTELTAEPDWAVGVPGPDLKDAAIKAMASSGTASSPRLIDAMCAQLLAKREVGESLAALGDRAEYVCLDITDPRAVQDSLGRYRDVVTGVVHGAGALADAFLPDKTPDQIDRVFRVKLNGLCNVLDAVDAPGLAHMVLFTSGAGLLGNPGQADYAAANEALCRFAAGWKHEHPHTRVTAIDWGAWRGGMLTPDLAAVFAERGLPLLDTALGTRAFVEQFGASHHADGRVLIGENKTPGGTHVQPSPAFTVRRDITGLADDPVIQAHRIDRHPVLPATYGLGWLINVAERANPGLCVVRVAGFQVHKGVIFDSTSPAAYRVAVEPGELIGAELSVRAVVHGPGTGRPTPHYAGTLTLAVDPSRAPVIDVPPSIDLGQDTLHWYTDATLFHGPPLQGIQRVLESAPARMVLSCRLADADRTGRAYHGRLHNPARADLLLQGLGVLGGNQLGRPCLPLGIGHAEFFAPLPEDEPFLVVVDAGATDGDQFTGTATATTAAGRVLQRFRGVDYVATPDLAGKFRHSVDGLDRAGQAS